MFKINQVLAPAKFILVMIQIILTVVITFTKVKFITYKGRKYFYYTSDKC